MSTAVRVLPWAIALLVAVWAGAPITTNDLFWHVKTGEHLWSVGAFPDRDPFSFTTARLPWVLHEWLTQLLFAGLHALGGLGLLRALTAAMALVIFGLFLRLARRRLGSPWLVAPTVLAFALLVACRMQTRPTLWSIALILVLVDWLSGKRGPWRVRDAIALVSLVVVWVNLHSVGLVALPLYGAFLVGLLARALTRPDATTTPRQLWLHAATLFAAALAGCANPIGWRLYPFAFQDKSSVMNFVTDEWGAFHLDWQANADLPVSAYVTVLSILAVLLACYLLHGFALQRETVRRRSPLLPDPVQLALLISCVGAALLARRFLWLAAVALVLGLAQLLRLFELGALTTLRTRARGAAVRVVAAVLCAGATVTLYVAVLPYERAPLHAASSRGGYWTRTIAPSLDLPGIRFLRDTGIEGNAFCHYGSGGMLSYWLYPRVKVFIDSRADLYRRKVLLDFLAVRDGRDATRILEAYGADIFYRHWEIRPLRDPRGWRQVYRGPDGEIWLRDTPRNRANFARVAQWQRAAAEQRRLAAAARPQ
ncbi:MAG: hypothetical protein H6837_00970 [Planctomycetes bacterium]|nr:hypothetical protein [Planctomycetota bacterium]